MLCQQWAPILVRASRGTFTLLIAGVQAVLMCLQAAKETEDLKAVLEDLAAKVEDLEAAVREKESTKKALRDAFSQVAGTHHTPIAKEEDSTKG